MQAKNVALTSKVPITDETQNLHEYIYKTN